MSSYAEFNDDEMTRWELLTEIVEIADVGILLDVNSIYVSSVDHGFDPMEKKPMANLDELQRELFRALLPSRGTSRVSTELSPSEEVHSPEFFKIAHDITKPGPSFTSADGGR